MTDSQFITCEQCQQRLEEYALDELSGDECAGISRHLATGCAPCNRRLSEILAGFAALPAGLATQLPPLRLERELMQRIAGEPADVHRALPAPATTSSGRPGALTGGLIGAAITLAACLFGIAAWTTWRAAAIPDRPVASESKHWEKLQRRVEAADRSQRVSSIPRLKFAYLNRQPSATPVHGHIVADDIAHQWHVYVFNLPPLVDRAYQLWLVTGDSQYVPAGTIEVDAEGMASRLVDLPSDVPSITGIAISDEPVTGSDAPTGESLYRADIPRADSNSSLP